VPVALLISFASFFITVGGVWFVTHKRVRDLESRVSIWDEKLERIIGEINDVKVEIARMQGGITSLNEKLDMFIQGRFAASV